MHASHLRQLYDYRLDPKPTYDTLQNLQAAEARLKAAKANLDLTHDQLNYTTLKGRAPETKPFANNPKRWLSAEN